MVAPAAVAAGKKAAGNPGGLLLVGGIALLFLARGIKGIPELPDLSVPWDRFREFGEVDIPEFTDRALVYPAELTDQAVDAAWRQSGSVVSGFWQGELDEDSPGPEYYAEVHYDPSGVPVAVPVEVNRTAKRIGRGIRNALGDWSIPGF